MEDNIQEFDKYASSWDHKSRAAYKSSLGRTIASAKLETDDSPGSDFDGLLLTFTDGSTLKMWDNGQSCCESRYMRTDDDLSSLAGTKLLKISIKQAEEASPDTESYDDCHDICFLEIQTDRGVVSLSNHNEHNGYYGGFDIAFQLTEPPQ